MIENVLKLMVGTLLETLPTEAVKGAVDSALDKIENQIEKSDNKIDDALVLPIIKKVVREPFGIKDND